MGHLRFPIIPGMNHEGKPMGPLHGGPLRFSMKGAIGGVEKRGIRNVYGGKTHLQVN